MKKICCAPGQVHPHFDDNIPGALYTLGRPDLFFRHDNLLNLLTNHLPVQICPMQVYKWLGWVDN